MWPRRIGPPSIGKTTLLRDICRIRLETIGSGLIIVDSNGELCGYGDVMHPLLRRARVFQVSNPALQGRQLDDATRSHGPEELATDEVQLTDIPLLITARKNGTNVVCSLHGGSIRDIIDHPHRRALLGVMQNPYDGTVAQREAAIFGMVIEVHAKGLYRVLTDVNRAISDHFAHRPLDYLYFGPWTDQRRAEALEVPTFAV